MAGDTDEVLVSRESTWQWLLHVLLWFFGLFFVLMGFAWDGVFDRLFALTVVLLTIGPSLYDLLRRRRVTVGPEGIAIGSVMIPWSQIERHTFREMPPVKAGLLLRLSEEGRAKLGITRVGRHLDERGERFDLYLRANGDRIEEWFTVVSLHALAAMGRDLEASAKLLVAAAAAQLDVWVVTEDPLTLSVHAASLDALEGDKIAKGVPSELRWDPGFDGGVMLLVGPLALGEEPGADAALERVTQELTAAFRGCPDVSGMWAERRRPDASG